MANVSNTNKKLKFGDNTENTINTVLEVGSIDVTKLEKEWVNSIPISPPPLINKPPPKYTKKEMLEVGDKKTVPNDWQYLIHTKKLGARGVVAASVYTPPTNPGPCCMNDLYEHRTNSGVGVYGQKYIWDATAGGTTLPYGSTTPYVDGFFSFSQESGRIPSSKQYNPPVLDNYLEFEGFSIKWTGKSAGIPGMPGMQLMSHLNHWAFPERFTDGLLSGIGMQTQLDWSNSVIAYAYINPPFPSDINYDERYAANFTWAAEQINKPNTVPPYTINFPWIGRLPIAVPFCQGRALINSGSRQRTNPSYFSYTNTQYGITGELSNPEPRRMGWEGWIVRPHNVAWNWGNRGAFVDVLHYTLGYAEDESNASNNRFINEWGVPQPWNGATGAVLDSTGGILSPSPPQRRTCAQGYCSYPQPSLLMYSSGPMVGQYLMLGHPNASYNSPQIGYSQLEHQRNCCANSQWFQNARVLRNYSESTWNMIGSPWAGGMNKITVYDDLVWETVVTLSDVFTNPATGLVGTNGNGPPEGESSDVKYSCTTFYTLNRILQYISSPSDFEEIFAKDYGNSISPGTSTTTPGFQELNPHPNQNGKRIWFPNQAGYYNENSNSNLTDDPWENMYRLRNVGLFYAMVNFCGDSSRDDITGGESGNLGNPPIAQLSGGQPTSQLTPGIWPWGHCISYACGNPEYSPNHDPTDISVYGGITYNKLGERGCEAQTPWASMPLNYYYSNITFSGIKVFFFDESTGAETSKILPQWSFSNSPEWSGEVPTTYEEASESVIGFMMWLGHNSWDYNITNSNGTIGRPAGNSGATGHGVGWWDPVDGDPQKGIPTLEGHYVFSLSNMSKQPSTNGYYKGIRPNYTYLDVVEHLTRMHQEFPLFMETSIFDYENRPTGVPKYIGGVPVPTTDKTGNPPTGIPRMWHIDNNSEPNNNPDWGGNPQTTTQGWGCDVYPGEGWTSFGNVTSNPVGTQGPNSSAWGTFPTGEGVKSIGDPGGGNYCTQDIMTYNSTITNASTPFKASWAHMYSTTSCSNWHMSMPCSPCSYKVNAYLNGCFGKGTIQNANSLGNTMGSVSWSPSTGGAGSPYKWIPGNIMGVSSVLGGPASHPGGWRARCQCSRWYPQIQNHTAPQLVTGPHCEGCNVGCCTNEFNSVSTCEYVYPQGLFKSKKDCARAYSQEPIQIPDPSVPALYAQQVATTPFGREKTTTSPLGDTTFCKLRPAGISGCMDSGALNYNPNATEDCSGSIAHTYTTIWNQAAGLWIPPQDNSCCIMAETGYKCDASQGGCHAVPGLWTVTTQAGSPGNAIYSSLNDCLAVWPTAASCAQEYLRRFVKACPCGDPYIAPQHEVNTHNQIMNGTLTPYDENTYWGEFTAGTSSNPAAWDITKRRGRLWDTWNDPYMLNGGVIHGPISRSYGQQTWWRGDYTVAPAIGGNACKLVWSSFWQTTVLPLITHNDLGRINWGANGSNRWEKAPSSTVEYEDCCLSHAYAFPGSKMFAGWITIDGAIPEVGQSFRPMEHISSSHWQDGNMDDGSFDGASINGNIPYKISYVADWEPRYGPNSVVENKSQINKDIVGSFGMDSYTSNVGIPNTLFLNSVNPLSPWNKGTACNIEWRTGGMGTSGNYDFTQVSCPNPSPAWSLWGQFGKTGGGGIAKQYKIPSHSTNPDAPCKRTCNSGNSNPCVNSKKWSEAKRLAPGTTDGKMPGYDFQGNWSGFDKNYYDAGEAPGSCYYHNTNLWTDRTEQCDWEPSNTKIQKLFAQPIHYAYHCGPPQWLWKGHQTCHDGGQGDGDQGWPGFCLPPPPARNTGGVARQSVLNYNAIQKKLPWRTGAWSIAWGFGKWMYSWKLHGGQNDREGYQTFMGCYDMMEQMNTNLPTNI